MDIFGSAIVLPAALSVNRTFNFLLFCQFLCSSLFLESPAFPEFRFTSHSSSYANFFFLMKNGEWETPLTFPCLKISVFSLSLLIIPLLSTRC